ncbi:unnamed protein product, partial [Polarella glacialis]
LTEAYQVLWDPQLRSKYDRQGKLGLKEGLFDKVDASVFFGLLFASQAFEPWVGELQMATQVEQMAKMADLAGMRGKSSVQGSQEMMKQRAAISKKLRQQRLRREVQCACHLRQKLDSWSLDPPDDVRFDAWRDARLEASSLARSQHGPELLIALGKAYRLQSQISLASQRAEPVSWTKKAVALTRRGILKWRYRGSFLKTLAGSLPCLKKVFDMAPKGTKAAELTDEQKQQIAKAAMDEALPRFLLIAWSLVIQDVNCTAQAVAKLLLSDTSVAAEVRRHRARALGRLGKIFLEEGLHARGSGDAEKQGDAQTKLREALAGSVRSKGSSQPATRASQTAQATRRNALHRGTAAQHSSHRAVLVAVNTPSFL